MELFIDMARIYNFASGPSIMALPVLEEAARDFVDYKNTGMSLLEMSHRGKIYDGIHNEAIVMVRELLGVPADYNIIFLQGGATLQFGMIPMAFLKSRDSADYVISGHWGQRAYNDAKVTGNARIAWDGKEGGYTRLPEQSELQFMESAAYAHICSNETIGGIQWPSYPSTGNVPLIIDMSSDVLSRPVEWEKVSMLYAGTQKNLAPAGMALIIIKKSLSEKARRDLPVYFRYDLHIDNNSLYNTPSTFVMWMVNLTMKWIKSIGGLPEIEKRRDEKAKLIYDVIDTSNGFYKSSVKPEHRSKMNVVWRLGNEALEKLFLTSAENEGLSGLKGHKSVGGCRASLYNAMPVEGAHALAAYMKHFMGKKG
jgi:phosphoserine aminotransferase